MNLEYDAAIQTDSAARGAAPPCDTPSNSDLQHEEDSEEDELYFLMAIGAISNVLSSGEKIPLRTSALSGEQRTQEILESENPRRILENMRMNRDVFFTLVDLIKTRALLPPRQRLSTEHQVHIFLHMVTHRISNRDAQETFQHSGETIHRVFHNVLRALETLIPEFVQLPSDFRTPFEIRTCYEFYPYFKDCIGALDGSLIPASVPVSQAAAFRSRKGGLAQNILAVCSFDMTFQYILAGWKGCANDSKVLDDAFRKGFTIPKGKYYLADAGYGLRKEILTPYRGVRYHLKE